jgi:apolipoprotein D and lipocalin family protein
MRHALVSLVLTTSLAFSAVGCGADPPLDVASNVDLGRFQGKWYEIARLPRETQTDCYGTTAFYSPGPSGGLQLVHQCNVGSNAGPLQTVAMTAIPNASVPAKLTLDMGAYTGDYWILEVGANYEYAVVGHPSRSYLWILSRTPSLDATTVAGAIKRAQNNQFDTSHLQWTPQPPSGERVSSDVPIGDVPPPMGTGCSIAPGSAAGWPDAVALALVLVGGLAERRASDRRRRRSCSLLPQRGSGSKSIGRASAYSIAAGTCAGGICRQKTCHSG